MDTLKKLQLWGAYALLAYMPFHIFLSQWLSTFTGGLNAWKVAKDVFTMLLVWLSFGLVLCTKSYKKTPYLLFVGAAFTYLTLHMALYFLMGNTDQGIAALGTVYNNRLIWYFIIGFSMVLLARKHVTTQKIAKITLFVSTLVCLFGFAQYLLPQDVMTHFGYSKERGVKPNFAIDDKDDLPRVFSTIRDPNSLGAYLIVPITLIWSLLFKPEHRQKRTLLLGLLMLHGLVLLLTFSRAAWIGVAISVAVVTWLQHKSWLKRQAKPIAALGFTILLVLGAAGYVLRDQYFVQNVIFHSDENTAAELDSNDLHFSLAEQGLNEFKENPLGDGPGTAGIVSIQNGAGGLLTENYYIQVLHEVGVLGFLIFTTGFLYILHMLKQNRNTFSMVLFASGAAYAVMCLVMHLFTNEAVATQWWLLSGFAIALGSSADARGKATRQSRK